MDKDLVALVDSGSSHTMINRSALPYGTQTARGPAKRTTTTNGVMSSNETATIQRIKCPEFNRIIHDLTGDVFDSPTCRYDIILGRRDIAKLGIKLDFSTHQIEWLNHSIPMKTTIRIP